MLLCTIAKVDNSLIIIKTAVQRIFKTFWPKGRIVSISPIDSFYPNFCSNLGMIFFEIALNLNKLNVTKFEIFLFIIQKI